MLTITTTGRIDQLRDRALQAESALAATNLQLEDAREEQRACALELAAAQTDLAIARDDLTTARDELAGARKSADEVLAAEARQYHRSEQFLRRDMDATLANRDRTIAVLRADLERARSTQPPAEEGLPEYTVLQFRTVGGGLAVVTGEPTTYYSDRYAEALDKPVEGRSYAWQCLTCGDSSGGYTTWDRDDMRRRANEHAAGCRAIPAGTADAEKAGARS